MIVYRYDWTGDGARPPLFRENGQTMYLGYKFPPQPMVDLKPETMQTLIDAATIFNNWNTLPSCFAPSDEFIERFNAILKEPT